jgi:hypothetical protein
MKNPTPKTDTINIDAIKNEATTKAEEISKKINKKVYPLVFMRPDTQEVFVGFIQEPSRNAKMEAFDIMSSKESLSLAGEVILSSSIIKEESHEAFSSLDSKYDDVYMGGCIDSLGHISVLINSLKKK